MLRARRFEVESLVGRIIQRRTREMTSGVRDVECRVERKVVRGFGVVVWRDRRWIVQRGILGEFDGGLTGI